MAKRSTSLHPIPVEQSALLKAIIKNHEEDTPRLAYADLLDETGGEANQGRPDFIRTQIAIARAGADECRIERQQALLTQFGAAWVGPLGRVGAAWAPGSASPGGCWQRGGVFRFRRGFVEEVSMSPAEFARLAGRLFSLHPIRAVHFSTPPQHRTPRGWLRPALARPEFRRVTAISFRDSCVDTGNLDELFRCENLGRVGCLDLSWTLRLTPAGFRRVASPAFAGLRTFTAHWACALARRDAPAVLAELVASPHLATLEEVDVWGNTLGDEGAAVVARASWPLRRLGLAASRMTATGARSLAGSPRLSGLRELQLAHNAIEDDGVVALAQTPHFSQVRVLDLTGTGVGDRGAYALATRPWLLERLALGRNPNIGEGAVNALRARYGDHLHLEDV